MSDKSQIEWTDATWNPVTGCTKITRGCDNCYAERIAERFRGTPGHPYENGFDLTLRPERLSQPLSWRRPRRVFVNSMSDLFHKKVPVEFIDQVFEIMEAAERHIFQVLTKRSSRMKNYLQHRYGSGQGPSHIWCGVSVEDHLGSARIRHLQRVPIPVRFLSIEPLLGPCGRHRPPGNILGHRRRGKAALMRAPCNPNWVLEIKDICEREEVDFFFKQWGGPTPKAGGRLLEGVEHNAMPLYTEKEEPRGFQMAS